MTLPSLPQQLRMQRSRVTTTGVQCRCRCEEFCRLAKSAADKAKTAAAAHTPGSDTAKPTQGDFASTAHAATTAADLAASVAAKAASETASFADGKPRILR